MADPYLQDRLENQRPSRVGTDPRPLDDFVGDDCYTSDEDLDGCLFTPDPTKEDPEDQFHYLRRCSACQQTTWSLHCPHDGHQNSCGHCGTRLPQSRGEAR